jgi:hypothetical protein
LARSSASINDLLAVVRDAESKYDTESKHRRAYKWLVKFSKRVNYYGNILDVLVQQAPEYTALAWGAMKILFVVRDLAQAASMGIADRLSGHDQSP